MCCLNRFLQQLGKDHAGVQSPDRRQFTSISDALQRLLPYHVFQGAPPSQDEFSQGTSRPPQSQMCATGRTGCAE